VLDGEGGYTVFGRLVKAEDSVLNKYLPLGLNRGGRIIKPVGKDSIVTYDDVVLDETTLAYKVRKTLEEESRKREK
jgi:predicted homoserine dehydrogenase-like protein